MTLSPGAKCFEVTAGDALVVSGKYVPDCEFEAPVHTVEKTDMVLGPEAIYKVNIITKFELISRSHSGGRVTV